MTERHILTRHFLYNIMFYSVLCRLMMFIIWIPPFVLDRIRWSEPGYCIWAVENNHKFVVFVSIAGYHGPSLIMIFCYIKVFMVKLRECKISFPISQFSVPQIDYFWEPQKIANVCPLGTSMCLLYGCHG